MTTMETILQYIPKKSESAEPKKWWHWVLMYPTLAIFLLGNVPTLQQLYLSAMHKVPFKKAYDAERQGAYWDRNLKNLDSENYKSFKVNRDGFTMDYRIFDSGDIMVFTEREGASEEDSDSNIRWIGVENLIPSTSASLFSVKEAVAQGWDTPLAAAGGSKRIICKRRLRRGRIMLRVQYGSGRCFEEIIQTGSGRIKSKRRVSCDSSCN